MPTIRVLVVEDSMTVRQRLIEILSADPEIEVVGEAGDGKQAIELCQRLRPSLITMDMMLPVMTGLAATEFIMAHCPTPILIVSASVNRGELFKTYDALAAGAVDVLDKPSGTEMDGVWEGRFIAATKMVSRIRVITHPRARLIEQKRSRPTPPGPARTGGGRYELVAIGTSTGGPGAIVEVLRGLPTDFRLPILFVLHINEPFGIAFADWLDGQTDRRVAYGREGEPIADAAGRVIMAPAGQHLTVRDGLVHLTRAPERHSCRPSVDVLFESIAHEYGARAVACLLTGMGRDGAEGLLRLRQAGALTIAQDEASSVIYGMPREAAMLGAANEILPLPEIGPRLALIGAQARGASS
ncbi:MAG TPA: chemotaxis-specific protein-glutamate methyltransferase CheB [Aliidongia sp.]|nr:chemotaxis-specific protein-glutamate methyltransferase CheB [Aliidongia sp.]